LTYAYLGETLKPVNMTPHQYAVLSLVKRFAPTTSAELARRLRISAQSAGESLNALLAKGLIQRSASPENKRIVVLTPTSAGKKLLLRLDRLAADAERRYFSCISTEDLESLIKTIQRIRVEKGDSP